MKVSAYKAVDGNLYATEKECNKHDNEMVLVKLFSNMDIYKVIERIASDEMLRIELIELLEGMK
jgi:hypothetical protein